VQSTKNTGKYRTQKQNTGKYRIATKIQEFTGFTGPLGSLILKDAGKKNNTHLTALCSGLPDEPVPER